MPDAINPQHVLAMTKTSLSANLVRLLESGSQTGRVLSQQAGGKTAVSIQGRVFHLDLKGSAAKPGDQLMLRLAGDQIVVEQKGQGKNTSSQSQAARSLTNTLSNMGLNQPNVKVIAQALLQAGMPLQQHALQELAQQLQNLSQNQLSTLAFLFSRGLPVSESLVSLFAGLFSQRSHIGPKTEKVLNSLREWIDELEEGDDESISEPGLKQLREHLKHLETKIPLLHPYSDQQFEEELKQLIQTALTTPEASLQEGKSDMMKSLSESLLRLYLLLLELKPHLENTPQADKLNGLIEHVKSLHENLSTQVLQNLPPQEAGQSAPIYLQLPFKEGDQNRELELVYKPKHDKEKAGSLDLRFELTHFGAVSAGFVWNHPQLTIDLVFEKEEFVEFVSSAADELKQALNDKGFQVSAINIKTGEVPDTLEPENSLLLSSTEQGFDVRV